MSNRREQYSNMERYKKTKREQMKRYYGRTAHKYERKIWTKEEDALVLEHKITDSLLSALIERSVGAIQTRRCTLNRLQAEG